MGATYADGRRILDCDAHIMEPPGWLESFATDAVRDRLPIMDFGDPAFVAKIERSLRRINELNQAEDWLMDELQVDLIKPELETLTALGAERCAP